MGLGSRKDVVSIADDGCMVLDAISAVEAAASMQDLPVPRGFFL